MGIEDAYPEAWKGIFVQNNSQATGYIEEDVLDMAWKYLENYLIWEDS
ncbi:hypothetical protein [Leadbetterella byssophila]